MGTLEIKSQLIERLSKKGYKLYIDRDATYEVFHFTFPDGKKSVQFRHLGEMLMQLDLEICPET